jgi:uncharacterized protein (TIGR03084 family)
MPGIDELVADLSAEQQSLDRLVASLSIEQWSLPTPAEGWTIRDQIAHLTLYDAMSSLAVRHPERFAEQKAAQTRDPVGYGPERMRAYAELPAQELLQRWRSGLTELEQAIRDATPGARVAWYGPSMSLPSLLTARIMEVWAHGQDVEDTGVGRRSPSDRLRHVVFLGVRTRGFSYANRGLPEPGVPVSVSVRAPSGAEWQFGDSSASESITGPARDFALVTTRRRHLADTRLQVVGPYAREWMEIAQVYAGGPGAGRAPGQFPPEAEAVQTQATAGDE